MSVIEINRNVLLPNLLTIGNGICGFVALATLCRMQAEPLAEESISAFATAAWLVFLGMVFDVFDGKVARAAGGSSALGAQLDSLADLITFGLVPAVMILQMNRSAESNWERLVTVLTLAYFLGATLRLARFTAENSPDESAHLAFKGLPTPAAGGCVASLVIFYCYLQQFSKPELKWVADNLVSQAAIQSTIAHIPAVLPFFALVLGFTMVSNRLVFDHAGSWFFGRKHSFDFFAYIIFGAVLAAVVPEVLLPIAFLGYLSYKPILFGCRRLLGLSNKEQSRSSAPLGVDENGGLVDRSPPHNSEESSP